jgi:hypothetical protein
MNRGCRVASIHKPRTRYEKNRQDVNDEATGTVNDEVERQDIEELVGMKRRDSRAS